MGLRKRSNVLCSLAARSQRSLLQRVVVYLLSSVLISQVSSANLQGCVVPLAIPVAKVALLGMEVVARIGTATLARTRAKKAAFCTILSMHQDQVRQASDSAAFFLRALLLACCSE